MHINQPFANVIHFSRPSICFLITAGNVRRRPQRLTTANVPLGRVPTKGRWPIHFHSSGKLLMPPNVARVYKKNNTYSIITPTLAHGPSSNSWTLPTSLEGDEDNPISIISINFNHIIVFWGLRSPFSLRRRLYPLQWPLPPLEIPKASGRVLPSGCLCWAARPYPSPLLNGTTPFILQPSTFFIF